MRKHLFTMLIIVMVVSLVLTGLCYADQAITPYNQRFTPVPGSSVLGRFLQNSSHLSQAVSQQSTVITPYLQQITGLSPVVIPVPSLRPVRNQTAFIIAPPKTSPGMTYTSNRNAVGKHVLTGGKQTVSGNGTGKNVVDANNQFAFDLFSDLDNNPADTGKNVFFSPFSISDALALAYEGARGTTADQIQSVFHYPGDNSTRRSEYSAIITGLNEAGSGYTLRTANALWAEKTYPFLPEFTRIAQDYYGADTTNLDFINHAEDSRKQINGWVETRTDDKIRDLLPAGSVGPDTKLVITNAIYFKGTWVKQFDTDQTKQDQFFVTSGTSVDVQMMQRTDKDAIFNYAETSKFQALELPYTHNSGKELSMLVVLPKGESLTAVENSLAGNGLSDLEARLTPQQVIVGFPKFRLETEYSLAKDLKAMGMPVAFSGNADFSGMDGTGNLVISDVIHKAYIDVNEEGTEAAAATGVTMYGDAMSDTVNPVPVFYANHPFIFFIQDKDTGAILFMGRVINPAGS